MISIELVNEHIWELLNSFNRNSHEHGAADQDEEVEAVLVGEERVPDADDVGQEELLGQQQGQPAEGEVLWLDVLLLLLERREEGRERG